MRWRVAVFGTLGTVATAVAAAFAFAPEPLLSVEPVRQAVGAVAEADPGAAMLAATLVIGLYVAVAARWRSADRSRTPTSDAEERFEAAVTEPPESVTADRRSLAATDLDSDVDAGVSEGGRALREVQALLADLATDAYAQQHHVGRQAAREAVDSGAWTDDRVAAALLAEDDGPTPSLGSRVRLWLLPERERERRVERATAAVEALQGGRR